MGWCGNREEGVYPFYPLGTLNYDNLFSEFDF